MKHRPRAARYRSISSSIQTLLILCFTLFLACAGDLKEAEQSVGAEENSVIYGADNRQDLYAHPDAEWRSLARRSIAVMVANYRINSSDPSNIRIPADTLGRDYDLCSDQRFRNQPTAGECSGTLVADDLILTAGHCINSRSCGDYSFVFDYLYEAQGRLARIDEDEVYGCRQIVAHQLQSAGVDFALVRLDRPVTGPHSPAPVRQEMSALREGDEVVLMGFPNGIPLKIARGGRVNNNRSRSLDYFEATVDAFGGNSGSGIFNNSGELVGVLVRGEQDYRYRNGCYVTTRLSEDENGEDITYAQNLLNTACHSDRVLSEQLCNGITAGWCTECRLDDDCSAGFLCGATGTCVSSCRQQSDCRDDHLCEQGRCHPSLSYRCHDGDIWAEDACGRSQGEVQACSAAQFCREGSCVERSPGDSCEAPIQIQAQSQILRGDLSEAQHSLQAQCGGRGPDLIYSFSLEQTQTLSATATGLDTVLYLTTGCAGQQLACNDDHNPPGGGGSFIERELSPGEYSLVLDSYRADASGAYTLELSFSGGTRCENECEIGAATCIEGGLTRCEELEGCAVWSAPSACAEGSVCEGDRCVEEAPVGSGDRCESPRELEAVSQVLRGDLRDYNADRQSSCGGRGPDVFFYFSLEQSAAYDFSVSGFDSVIYLLASCDRELDCNDDATPPGNLGSRLSGELEPGGYLLALDAYSQGGEFSLSLLFETTEVCEDLCAAGASRCVEAGLQSCVQADSGCRIWGAAQACPGEQICEEGACRELSAPPSGEGERCEDATHLEAISQRLTGDLRDYEANLRGSCGGNGADRVYRFELEHGARFEALASGIDTVLYLRSDCDSTASELSCDDDSTPPGNRGSRISAELPAGEYFLIIDAYRNSGNYRLDLSFR